MAGLNKTKQKFDYLPLFFFKCLVGLSTLAYPYLFLEGCKGEINLSVSKASTKQNIKLKAEEDLGFRV